MCSALCPALARAASNQPRRSEREAAELRRGKPQAPARPEARPRPRAPRDGPPPPAAPWRRPGPPRPRPASAPAPRGRNALLWAPCFVALPPDTRTRVHSLLVQVGGGGLRGFAGSDSARMRAARRALPTLTFPRKATAALQRGGGKGGKGHPGQPLHKQGAGRARVGRGGRITAYLKQQCENGVDKAPTAPPPRALSPGGTVRPSRGTTG